jgi:hypothetical protein
MFTPNNIFVDSSSVLIEYRKGSKTELLEHLFEQDYQPFIGHPVISEFLYHNLSIFSGKSPLTIKSNGEIGIIIDKSNPHEFLSLFGYLTDYKNLQYDVIEIMSKYNLLPTIVQLLLYAYIIRFLKLPVLTLILKMHVRIKAYF